MFTDTIETANGVYKLKRPAGRIGMIHFALLSKMEARSKEKDKDGNPVISPADEERFEKALLEWSEKVLKNILIPTDSYLYDIDKKTGEQIKVGITYDDIPGEDQYCLFCAISSKVNLMDADAPFRFV